MKLSTPLLSLSTAVLLTGCKIQLTALDGGDIYAKNAGFVCDEQTTCSANVDDTTFNESFQPRAKEGYTFDSWVAGDGLFCGGKKGTCDLSTAGFEGNQPLLDVLDSGREFYLIARFKPECYSGSSELGGMYREPLRLCREGSPYTVTSDIQLGPEAPLFIDAGVTLNSTSPTGNRIVAYSNLYLLGKPKQKVRINDLNIETAYNGQTSTIDINHTLITYPKTQDVRTPSLDMVFTEAGGYARLTDSEIHASVFFNAGTSERVSSTLSSGKSPLMATRIERNRFVDSGLLLLIDTELLIKNNLWSGEGTELVVRRAGKSKIVATQNSFLATTPESSFPGSESQWNNSVIIEPNSTSQEVDLSNNFWGTTNRAEVADEIWDANDTFDVEVTGVFEPVLGKPHPKTPAVD
ncbi:hypothetical protein [Parahaliea mediterranea]|uniref:Bacterial repeat domain-containing protein n=1 Tax=Parahaliea mediterranea TaxID=651086 RepID=A0A939DD09_9GAMM|nr:hypothetical protein [Parahaliea mediterranea]MBN7795943.1 hypothetical protein [Parahaliea mediterranea]